MNALSGLQEYEKVLARTRFPKVAIQRAFRTLMQRQFIFGNDFGSKDVYELLNDNQVRPFAERLFDVFGWRFDFVTKSPIGLNITGCHPRILHCTRRNPRKRARPPRSGGPDSE